MKPKKPPATKKNKIIANCPHCKSAISNVRDLFYNQKYQCSVCEGKFFIIKDIISKYQ